MNSGITMYGRCKRLLYTVQDYNQAPHRYWMVLAKDTPWAVENAPPIMSDLLVTMPSPLVFIYVHQMLPCFKDASGTIVLATSRYQPVFDLNPISLTRAKAHNLLIEAIISKEDLALYSNSYRAAGLAVDVDLDPAPANYEAGTAIPPSQVKSYALEWLSTFREIKMEDQDNHSVQIVRTY
jgi:hypothetical protein